MSSWGDRIREARKKGTDNLKEKKQSLNEGLKTGDFRKASSGLLGTAVGLIGVTAALNLLNN